MKKWRQRNPVWPNAHAALSLVVAVAFALSALQGLFQAPVFHAHGGDVHRHTGGGFVHEHHDHEGAHPHTHSHDGATHTHVAEAKAVRVDDLDAVPHLGPRSVFHRQAPAEPAPQESTPAEAPAPEPVPEPDAPDHRPYSLLAAAFALVADAGVQTLPPDATAPLPVASDHTHTFLLVAFGGVRGPPATLQS